MKPPGLMRADIQPEVLGMIGTAGHVDHGKTRLVKMLTGCSTDRLKAEQERGLTIELGFAPCFLGDNLCAGIVDVPGHERFVRTMVAGVSGIDLTLLTVAADDGIMPQTIEHVQIMELLGVRDGMVALTKIDLVDPQRVAERTAEITAFLQGSFLEKAPVFPVSAETGDGYDAFYTHLVQRMRALRRQSTDGVFRMPVERMFNQTGFGEVVTGVPVSGRIRVGDTVTCSPGGAVGQVRGLQCFLRTAQTGGAGQCLALNVPEWGKTPPHRGQVIVPPGYLPAAGLFYVQLQSVPHLDPPLRHAELVRFHTGTAEVAAKLFLLDDSVLDGGLCARATLLTEQPVAAGAGDRFILRRASPAATVAGGRIRIVDAGSTRPRRPVMRARLVDWENFFDGYDADGDAGAARRVEYAVRQRGAKGISALDAAHDALIPPRHTTRICEALLEAGRIRMLKGDQYLHQEAWNTCRDAVRQQCVRARESGALMLAINEIGDGGTGMPLAVRAGVLQDLERSGLIRLHGERLLLYSDPAALPAGDRILAERMIGLYDETGYQSPRPDELPERLGVPAPAASRILDYLVSARRLVRVSEIVIVSAASYRAAQDIVVATIRRDGALESPAFRDRLQTTRKYAMSLLDYMDAQRITIRHGNTRRLLPGYEQRLRD